MSIQNLNQPQNEPPELQVAKKLRRLATKLKQIKKDDELATQLEDWLEKDPDGKPTISQSKLNELANLDLRSILDPAAIEERFILQKRSGCWLGVVEWFRNILVFLPIAITWFELSRASANYSSFDRLLEKSTTLNPDDKLELLQKPFLLLWETGFNGVASSWDLTFSTLAFVDFGLLAGLIVLTFVVHYSKDIQERRVEDQASKLRLKAEEALWGLEQLVAPQRSTQDLATAIGEFKKKAEEILKSLKKQLDELNRLAQERKTELDKIKEFHEGLEKSADSLKKQAAQTNAASHRIELSTNALTATMAATQHEHQKHVNSIEKHVAELGAYQQTLDKTNKELQRAITQLQLQTAAMQVDVKRMTEAAERMNDLADLLYRSISDLGKVSAELKAVTEKMLTSNEDIVKNIYIVVTRLNSVATSILNRLDGVATRIDNASLGLGGALNPITTELGNIRQTNEGIAANLDTLVTNQQNPIPAINKVIKNLKKLIQEQKNTRTATDDITQKLQTLPSVLVSQKLFSEKLEQLNKTMANLPNSISIPAPIIKGAPAALPSFFWVKLFATFVLATTPGFGIIAFIVWVMLE